MLCGLISSPCKVLVVLPSVLCVLNVFLCSVVKNLKRREASAARGCRKLAVTTPLEELPLTGKRPDVHLKTVRGGKQIFLEVPFSNEPLVASLSPCLNNNQAFLLSVIHSNFVLYKL